MNKDLALKLKDAGLNFTLSCSHCQCSSDDEYEPTLSQLIEACGDDFCGLMKRTDWLAIGNPNGKHETGSTPEESVAKLWLALNSKNNEKL